MKCPGSKLIFSCVEDQYIFAPETLPGFLIKHFIRQNIVKSLLSSNTTMEPAATSYGFSSLEAIPLDPHYALKEAFADDPSAKKVILGSGIYRDGNSEPWVLPSIEEVSLQIRLLVFMSLTQSMKAEKEVDEHKSSARYEYLPISGYAPFVTVARDLLFGRYGAKADHFVSLQTISGTGANSLGAQFLSKSLRPSAVWLSNPSWVNHSNIWGLVGVKVKYYPYWDAQKKTLDFDSMVKKLETETVSGDVILLHACAHNPTGVDPTKEQWAKIADICESRGLFPFFDSA